MAEWKPKNLEEALEDAIGSAINDNEILSDDENYLLGNDYDKTVKDAIKNIKDIKGLEIIYKDK